MRASEQATAAVLDRIGRPGVGVHHAEMRADAPEPTSSPEGVDLGPHQWFPNGNRLGRLFTINDGQPGRKRARSFRGNETNGRTPRQCARETGYVSPTGTSTGSVFSCCASGQAQAGSYAQDGL